MKLEEQSPEWLAGYSYALGCALQTRREGIVGREYFRVLGKSIDMAETLIQEAEKEQE